VTSRAALFRKKKRDAATLPRKKQRYAEDAEYRQQRRDYIRAWKRRRLQDPEYRERTRAYSQAWHLANREALAARKRRRWAADPDRKAKRRKAKLKSYGLTVEDYDAMLARQDGTCAICLKIPTRRLCVDHCHDTRIVRKLLCLKCNTGLGLFDHDPQRLRRAADYLEAFLPRKRKRRRK
jgi:hypothetical protein